MDDAAIRTKAAALDHSPPDQVVDVMRRQPSCRHHSTRIIRNATMHLADRRFIQFEMGGQMRTGEEVRSMDEVCMYRRGEEVERRQ